MTAKPFHTQLKTFGFLGDEDFDVLDGLLQHEETADPAELLVIEGSAPGRVSVLLEGWAVRYKSLSDGRRQILNFLLPGDAIGFFGVLLQTADYGVEALTPIRMHSFSFERLFDAFQKSPRLAIALSWLAAQDERQLAEQIMRIGRRGAAERMAHLFMELHHRLVQTGMPETEARSFPLTQTILADTLGMSHVHANRSFRTLVRQGLVALRKNRILLLDPNALAKLAGFDAAYLYQKPILPSAEQALPD